MKTISTLVLLMLVLCSGIRAQEPIIVSEDSLKFGNGMLPGISVLIPEVEYEKTLNTWIKILQSGTKSPVATENTEMSIFGAIIKNITESPINVYSRLTDQDSVLKLAVSMELKKDQFIERATGEAELSKAKSFLFNFAKDQYIDLVNDQVKVEENKLRDLEKELGSLEKDQSGMEKSIRNSNKTITAEKERLITLNNELTTLSAAIIEHRNLLSSMEAGVDRDEKTKYVKDLEKQKKKKVRAITSCENKISKAENVIQKADREIPKNVKDQGKTSDRVTEQEAVYQRFVDKLNTIKGYR